MFHAANPALKILSLVALFALPLWAEAAGAQTSSVPEQSGLPGVPGPVVPSASDDEADGETQDSQLEPPQDGLPSASGLPESPGMTLNADDAGVPQQYDFEKTAEQLEAEKRSEAFGAALQAILPLKPDEIRQLLEHFDRTQESVEIPVYPSPKPEVAVETISLEPGAKPVVVKLAYGNVTTLNFLDVSGAPWPIKNISWAGNFDMMDSSTGDDDGSHIIRITPKSEFAAGNMSISLLTLKTPVIISLETNRDMVHYRFDAVIPEYGPFAKAPIIDPGLSISAGDENISSILRGAAPGSAQKLTVTGADGRTSAYKFNGLTYVRTPLALLSPGWSSSVASADGMRVYAINNAPVLLLSDKGKLIRARLSERENILENVAHD